ncbi:MAG: hypothetical protein H0X07_06300, partial [Gemmatimonadales bacterium]|nr:hypothetical protein [Gemmatimonadales bacterium]
MNVPTPQTKLEMLDDMEPLASVPSTAPKGTRLRPGEAKSLKQRMDVAEKYYEKVFKPWFDDATRMMKGEHYEGESDDHQVVVNLMPHVIQTQVYSTTFHLGELIVKPKDRLGHENLEVAEHVTACELRQANAMRENRRAYKDSRIVGFGVVCTGWEFETDDVHLTDGRQQVEGEEPEPEAVTRAVEEGKDLPPPIPRAKVRKDNFYVKRLDPRNWRVSPEASWVLADAPYCGYVEYRDVAEVKNDPRYKNTSKLKGSCDHLEGYLNSQNQPEGDREDLTGDLKRVKLIHYYERRRRLHVVLTDEDDRPLLVEKWHWEHDEYPFLAVFAEPGEDGWYQRPPVLELKHCQQELNNFHTQLAIHIRRFVRKYVAREGDFDPNAEKALESGRDGTIVFTTAQDAHNALTPIQDAQLSPDVYGSERIAMERISLMSALSAYDTGRAPTKRMTQDEAQMVGGAGEARKQAARAAYEELCAAVARHCLALNQQYAMRTRSYPVEVDGKISTWVDWTADQIRGDYSFELYVGSTEIKSKASVAEEIGFLLQSLAPFAA